MLKKEQLQTPCSPTALASFHQALTRLTPLPAEAWQASVPHLAEYVCESDEFFLEVGQTAEYAGFVLKGVLREFFLTRAGAEFNKNFNLPGEFTGSLFDLLTGAPSTAAIQALTPTQLVVIKFTALQKLYSQYSAWEHIGRLIAENLFMLKARREWEFMTLAAEERYVALLEHRPGLEEHISQYHLASYLGISPVSLSRIRRRLGKVRLR